MLRSASLLLTLQASIVALAALTASDQHNSVATSVKGAEQERFIAADTSCPAPSSLPLSCSNGSAPQNKVNACCTNYPSGLFLQTQFWDTDPVTGPTDSWTIHGLWPDLCSGQYQDYCDFAPEYSDIRTILEQRDPSLLNYMDTYWVSDNGDDNSFWSHEWSKHGTCVSTLGSSCYTSEATAQYQQVVDYFQRAVQLFKTLPTYDWLAAEGIVPSTSETYSLAQLEAAIQKHYGYKAVFNCQDGALDEIYYAFVTRGPLATGEFIPTAPDAHGSSCPDTGIRYLPK